MVEMVGGWRAIYENTCSTGRSGPAQDNAPLCGEAMGVF